MNHHDRITPSATTERWAPAPLPGSDHLTRARPSSTSSRPNEGRSESSPAIREAPDATPVDATPSRGLLRPNRYCEGSLPAAFFAARAALILASVACAAAILRCDFEAPPLLPNFPITADTEATANGSIVCGAAGRTDGSRKRPCNPVISGIPRPPFSAHNATFTSDCASAGLIGGTPGQTSLAASLKRISADFAANAVASTLLSLEGVIERANRTRLRGTSKRALLRRSYVPALSDSIAPRTLGANQERANAIATV